MLTLGSAGIPRQETRRPAGTEAIGCRRRWLDCCLDSSRWPAAVFISVRVFRNYGVALFFGGPFIAGAIGGFIFNRRFPAGLGGTIGITTLTFGLAALILMAFRAEGLICLVMAVPILGPVAVLGAALGRAIARHDDRSVSPAMFALLAIPLSVGLEPLHVAGRTLHEVQSSVVIEAPPARVWPHVIAFAPMREPLEPLFRLGIASPQYARIEEHRGGRDSLLRLLDRRVRRTDYRLGGRIGGLRSTWTFAGSAARVGPYRQLSAPLDGCPQGHGAASFAWCLSRTDITRLEGSTWAGIGDGARGLLAAVRRLSDSPYPCPVLEHIKSEVDADGM
jgi:hypothetical protein